MLNRGTLVLLVSAIALGGAVLLFENRQADSPPVAEPGASAGSITAVDGGDGENLFPFEEEDIDRFSLTRPAEGGEATEALSFAKQDDGTWQMVTPRQAMAESGAIAFLLSQLTSPASRTLTVEADTLEEFGLADPEASVVLSVEGVDYTFYLGGSDFSGDSRYAQAADSTAVDLDAADSGAPEESTTAKVHVLSGSIENAINRPTAEWLVAEASPEAEDTSAVETPAEPSGAAPSATEAPDASSDDASSENADSSEADDVSESGAP
ncbi:MAG: DUF4340 domain-containing protein [Cyanobacteria bacterium J06626_6]